jgi:phospholipase/lecithinase/hemolysin
MKFSAVFSLVAISAATVSAFDKIILYGDSLSDNGNDFKNCQYPSAPYYKGRFSNGPTWFEYVAKGLPKYDVINNAYGGATTDNADAYSEYNNWVVPGFKQQIETLETGGTSKSLYLIYFGYNDLNSMINPGQYHIVNEDYDYHKVIKNVANGIKLLQNKYQAKNFLIINTIPFYHWPVVAEPKKQQAKALIHSYNSQLKTSLKKIRGANFKFLDDNTWFEQQIAHPEILNLSTSIGPCAYDNGTVCDDPENHFFFDFYHPEAKVHKAYGAWALKKMKSLYKL